MKKVKQFILVGTLGATILLSGIANAAGAAPLWYQNYMQGRTTPVGVTEETKTPAPVNTQPESTGLNYYSNDYWRTKTPTQPTVNEPAAPVVEEKVQGVTTEEQELFNLLNQSRASRGLKTLKINPKLVELARLKARDMAENHYFSHTSPTYGKAIDMVRNAGIQHWIAGENIAITSSASRANTLFMGSSVHRATMLNRNYTEVGVGMYRASNGSLYVAEIFIGTR